MKLQVLIAAFMLSSLSFAWDVPDNGSDTALSNNQSAGNYRVRRTGGGDHSLKIVVKDKDGKIIFEDDLPNDEEGVLVGVPKEGSVTISDPDDKDSFGANGTIVKE